jgi:hypothetical protein
MDARVGRLMALAIVSGVLALTLVHYSLELGNRVVFGDNPPMLATLTLSAISFFTAYASLSLAERRRISIALECLSLAILVVLAVRYIAEWASSYPL